jgi:succinate dehydrogenase / fumarate reductase cytochrome b subunit
MAQVERPLSPHLQVYKPQLTSVLSILHRITGIGLGIGTVLLAWWLVSAAYGPDHFEAARSFIGAWFGRLLLFGFTFSLFYHLCNGIRHLFWDAGWGFQLKTAYASGWLVVIASIGLTIVSWFAGYANGGVL